MTLCCRWRGPNRVRFGTACIALLAGCATVETGSYSDPGADFTGFRTFAWIGESAHVSSAIEPVASPLIHAMIAARIRDNLVAHGYTYTDDRDDADMLVSYTIGTRDKLRMDAYPEDFRGHWGWHRPYSHYYFRHVEREQYTQGTLGVDIFDNASGRPVWHGWAQKAVTEKDRRDPQEAIERGIDRLFASFPG